MKKRLTLIFQIAAVFVGTIVGAGLASGQEITQFFTTYGYKSFLGIVFCFVIYSFMSTIIIKISVKYNLTSYNELISLVMPQHIGKFTDLVTGFFMISSSAIILAGSGALFHQYFKVSPWVGIGLMVLISIITLLKDTKGLITINSFIVPSLIIVILTVFSLYLFFHENIFNIQHIKSIETYKNPWLISSLLYGGFNILCCTGVLVPLSSEIKETKSLCIGSTLGAAILTLLCFMINLMLLLNIPYIFKYDIPLLYIANPFGKGLQLILLVIIFFEMFSTEVSDIYSVAKTLKFKFNIPYKIAVLLILCFTVPMARIGFKNLITFLYPAFGGLSLIFIICCMRFYKKNI
ncbi:YkvI family membrane protein [Haloimpatiens lingqiaonensis]|uniref:YkvI family membrane protein n=1 Tax=Haloimpatiens lingqiaonensis TaxID=1380675 RepID=UPI0010FDDB98|nr:transporter [Haloimpatiens lingqiaonensis]